MTKPEIVIIPKALCNPALLALPKYIGTDACTPAINYTVQANGDWLGATDGSMALRVARKGLPVIQDGLYDIRKVDGGIVLMPRDNGNHGFPDLDRVFPGKDHQWQRVCEYKAPSRGKRDGKALGSLCFTLAREIEIKVDVDRLKAVPDLDCVVYGKGAKFEPVYFQGTCWDVLLMPIRI